MPFIVFILILLGLNFTNLQAQMAHHTTSISQIWKEENLLPFDELLLSWNAERPANGKFLFYISVKVDDWSAWLPYASWGAEDQSSFQNASNPVKIFQDTLEISEKQKATGFQIKIETEGKASLSQIRGLHVYTNGDKESEPMPLDPIPVELSVSGLSQISLSHSRNMSFCSPVSTTAVVRFLSKNENVDPINLAEKVWDKGFDIYGNWVLNVAQAAAELGPKWHCWVERLEGFASIHQRLRQGTPVVVSVRGPLTGSALPYAQGHLIAIIGYNPSTQKVLCMDPGFPTDEKTLVSYDLVDFLQAWNRRGKIAYIFAGI